MADHALLFKVLRLRPPLFELHDHFRFSFEEDVAQGVGGNVLRGLDASEAGGNVFPFADRIETSSEMPCIGIGSDLILQQPFGSVYLGQTVRFAIVLSNVSMSPTDKIGVRIDIQSDKAKATLHDTMSMPSSPSTNSLGPGDHYEVVVQYEVKDLGTHTLLCSSSYVGPTGDLRYHPQAFRFQVRNPMVIKTKHRSIKNRIFLEVNVENATQEVVLIQTVDLVTPPEFRVVPAGAQPPSPPPSKDVGPLVDYIDTLKLLSKVGDAHSFVFQLERTGPAPHAPTPVGGAPDLLGRVEIKWRCVGGDPGRLLTQSIGAPPSPYKDAWFELAELPSKIDVFTPFEVVFKVYSSIGSRLGPLKVSFNQSLSGGDYLGKHIQDNSVVMDGPQSVVIRELPANGNVSVKVILFPKASGRLYIQKFLLTDDRDGRVLDTLRPFEIFVHGKPE